MEPWICHEAGHVTTALHLGFRVDGIEIFQGKPRTMCDLYAADRTNEERYVFLAGGIAGETSDFRNYDRAACGDDQARISELGGGSIETYLPAASGIIKAHKGTFDELKKKEDHSNARKTYGRDARRFRQHVQSSSTSRDRTNLEHLP
jgi:hypothetical protein